MLGLRTGQFENITGKNREVVFSLYQHFVRFMDGFDPEMVPNTSDDEERYSYQNQPDVGAYNLDKLRQALEPLLSRHQQKQASHY